MSLYPIVLGLIVAGFYGLVDFLNPQAVKKEGSTRALFFYALLGTVFLIIFGALTNQLTVKSVPIPELVIVCLGGLVGYFTFYRSFRKGQLSVVVPISSAWAAVTVITSIILFGETLSTTQAIGIVFAIAGTILVSFKYSELRKQEKTKAFYNGVPDAVAAMLVWGIAWAFYKPLVAAMGITLPVIAYMAVIVAVVGVGAPITRTSLRPKATSSLLLIAAIGFFSVTGSALYNVGMQTELVSLVAPISALSPLVAIALARRFRGERTELNQNIGILFIALALVLLAL